MRKATALFLFFTLLFAIFTGCNAEESTRITPTATIEESGLPQLSICTDTWCRDYYFKEILNDFTSAHKGEIEVTYTLIDEYDTESIVALRTEIMAGKGPDIFLLTPGWLVGDLERAMRTGTFADLTPLLDTIGFAQDEYVMPVIEAGRVEGRQYIMPLSYSTTGILGTVESLHNLGLDGPVDITETIAILRENLPNQSFTDSGFTYYGDTIYGSIPYLDPFLLVPSYDYNTASAWVDNEVVRDILDFSRERMDKLYPKSHHSYVQTLEELARDDFYMIATADNCIYISSIINDRGFQPAFQPLRNADGGASVRVANYFALSTGADEYRQALAADLLEIMLSEQYQGYNDKGRYNSTSAMGMYPVRRGSEEKRLELRVMQMQVNETTDEVLADFAAVADQITYVRLYQETVDSYANLLNYVPEGSIGTTLQELQAYLDLFLGE